jgi:Prokaryotic metallothionein
LLFRLIFFLPLIFLLLLLIRSYLAHSRRRPRGVSAVDDMALDPQCQSYVPKRAAIERRGNYFCSRECAERYLAR